MRRVAAQYWSVEELPDTGSIMVTIIYFYDSVTLDVDNIPKPILDALKGLVYVDDEQVTDIVCRKRDLNTDVRIENPSSILSDGLASTKQFLYIAVDEAPEQGVI